jgi:predicted metalloprotease with PDZ domain
MIRRLFVPALVLAASALGAQAAHPAAVSAPVTDITYRVTFDRALAAKRAVQVEMNFKTAGNAPVILSLPAWTPGAYEISYFARWVTSFSVTSSGKPLSWEKTDYDTWRILPAGATQISVDLEYRADSLDNAMAWARPDFLMFNGTNLFLYPEGRSPDFPALVRIVTDSAWRIATGMTATAAPNTFSAANYHDLVDMPFFVGRIGIDSTHVGGGWARLAWYPMESVPPDERAHELFQIAKLIPVESAVFGETPWKSYTVMQLADSSFGGLSGLEHQNSHVDIITPLAVGDPILGSFYAHEIFHAWNVKRLRPIDLWPYDYGREQPTPWLWVSEGITDYYADLSEVRAGLIDSAGFFELIAGKIAHVANTRTIALNDASLNAWIHPVDGTDDIYYDKGSLAGLMLDILIRDASDNKRSLDDVMRNLYRDAYKKGAGFTAAQWWNAVSAAAGGKSFADFDARYIEGRDPYPWSTVLPLAGLILRADTVRAPALGVAYEHDSIGAIIIASVDPGSMAAEAGIRPGDRLVAVGDIAATDRGFLGGAMSRYQTAGETVVLKVRRGASTLSLPARVQIRERVTATVAADPRASAKAAAIRTGLMRP